MDSLPEQLTTERLHLKRVGIEDAGFMLELLNTEGWIRFIGDRNIRSMEDAQAYIERLLNAQNLIYWVVRAKSNGNPAGIVSFLKRDYLEHFDIGFAFIPESSGQGYALEATKAVLDTVTRQPRYHTVLATTMPSNTKSIRLLERLGFRMQMELEQGGEPLLVYANT
jgi:RimJ/RimL family protein N-acetyltransferase